MPRPTAVCPIPGIEEPVFDSVQEKNDVLRKLEHGNMMFLYSNKHRKLEQRSFMVSFYCNSKIFNYYRTLHGGEGSYEL